MDYVHVTKHALGRLCQRGGARTECDLENAVLTLHSDVGRLSAHTATPLLSASEGETIWFPSEQGAWGLEWRSVDVPARSLDVPDSAHEYRPDMWLVARTWLHRDGLEPAKEDQAGELTAALLKGPFEPGAMAAIGGPLSPQRHNREKEPPTS